MSKAQPMALDARRLSTRMLRETRLLSDARFGREDAGSGISPQPSGDVIAMGTPAGVGQSRTPPVWMKAGDTIEVEIEGVGLLVNTIEDEQP